ncbi:MAG: hypothetical protein A2Z83_00965 [Omnitrophica bacterium GWA2_52_8]|nr:MAG: hypothetical protein A2Z83_00965 [Omnitrophica bacterium GWA2_52_8]
MKKSRDRIVFLDAGSVNYGDLSFGPLEKLGLFKAYASTRPDEIERRTRGVRFVVTNKCVFDRRLISRLKGVECIHVSATGVNNIDREAAREFNVGITNVSGYSTESVVQWTIALMTALAGNLISYQARARDGTWSRSSFFTLGLYPNRELAGKKLGIIGYGNIGRRVAEVARCLGMNVLVGRIPGRKYSRAEGKSRHPFDIVVRQSDFLTLHAPLTPLTQDLIGGRVLRKMKRGAVLINMARGGIVNERAWAAVLHAGHLGGGAADVLTIEPPVKNHPLLKAPRMIVTPHVAWATLEARERLVRELALNIKAFQLNRRRNRIV